MILLPRMIPIIDSSQSHGAMVAEFGSYFHEISQEPITL